MRLFSWLPHDSLLLAAVLSPTSTQSDAGPIVVLLVAIAFGVGFRVFRIWRRRMQPAAFAVAVEDREAFLYQLTEALRSDGYQRRPTPSGVEFRPPAWRRFFGHRPVAVDMTESGGAVVSGQIFYVRNLRRHFPRAVAHPYAGSLSFGQYLVSVVRLVTILVSPLAVSGALLLGYIYYQDAHRLALCKSADIHSALTVAASEASDGTVVKFRPSGRDEEVELRIPRNVKSGAQLRYRGAGVPAEGDGPACDLYVEVSVK